MYYVSGSSIFLSSFSNCFYFHIGHSFYILCFFYCIINITVLIYPGTCLVREKLFMADSEFGMNSEDQL